MSEEAKDQGESQVTMWSLPIQHLRLLGLGPEAVWASAAPGEARRKPGHRGTRECVGKGTPEQHMGSIWTGRIWHTLDCLEATGQVHPDRLTPVGGQGMDNDTHKGLQITREQNLTLEIGRSAGVFGLKGHREPSGDCWGQGCPTQQLLEEGSSIKKWV